MVSSTGELTGTAASLVPLACLLLLLLRRLRALGMVSAGVGGCLLSLSLCSVLLVGFLFSPMTKGIGEPGAFSLCCRFHVSPKLTFKGEGEWMSRR